MNDSRKTKAQLIQELQDLRRRLAEHEADSAQAPQLSDPEVLDRFAARGAWVVDTDFIVRVANAAMCRVLDKSPDEVVGQKCYELMSGPSCHTEACAMRRAFATPSTFVAREQRVPVGKAPLTCRVVAHLVRDRDQDPVGIVEQLDDAKADRIQTRRRSAAKKANRASRRLPASEAGVKLAEVALQVAEALRARLSDDDRAQDEIDELERACAPWRGASSTAKASGKPALLEVGLHRSVLIFAPPTSRIRCAWAEVVRRGGYTLLTAGDDDAASTSLQVEPTVAIIDLALGEPVADEHHQRLRKRFPQMPILVVSSSTSDALEARRWRRACTWYVPRAVGADELVRLIEDVSPRPVLRSRPER